MHRLDGSRLFFFILILPDLVHVHQRPCHCPFQILFGLCFMLLLDLLFGIAIHLPFLVVEHIHPFISLFWLLWNLFWSSSFLTRLDTQRLHWHHCRATHSVDCCRSSNGST